MTKSINHLKRATGTCCADVAHAQPAAPLPELPETVREAYQLMLAHKGAISAYSLIEVLQQRVQRRIYPQTVYRALAMLVEKGLAHRLESVNGYHACSVPGTPHAGIHFMCSRCGGVEETVDPRIDGLLSKDALQRQFAIASRVIEVHGVCGTCLPPR